MQRARGITDVNETMEYMNNWLSNRNMVENMIDSEPELKAVLAPYDEETQRGITGFLATYITDLDLPESYIRDIFGNVMLVQDIAESKVNRELSFNELLFWAKAMTNRGGLDPMVEQRITQEIDSLSDDSEWQVKEFFRSFLFEVADIQIDEKANEADEQFMEELMDRYRSGESVEEICMDVLDNKQDLRDGFAAPGSRSFRFLFACSGNRSRRRGCTR